MSILLSLWHLVAATLALGQPSITRYELAKRIAQSRGSAKVTDVSSIVAQTLDSPEGRRFSNVAEVIEAMGGELTIRWHNTTERVIK